MKNSGSRINAIKELEDNKNVSHLYSEDTSKDGSLKELIVTLKDVYATDNAKTQASSKMLEGFNPGYNATSVQRLIDNGADIIAKVHMDELALGGSGQFSAFGAISHPLDDKRIVGGSSSGSAATFTKSIGIAMGSDTGDSVRLPASYIGAYGFKPSYGAISRYGVFAFASSLDTVGYFAHNINDIVKVSNVLYGIDELDMTSKVVEKPTNEKVKPKKIGVLKNTVQLEKYQSEKYDDLKNILKNDGIEVVEFDFDQILLDSIETVYQIISFAEASSNDSNLNGISFGPGQDGNDWDKIMHNTRTNLLGEQVQRRFTLGAYFLSTENQEDTFKKAQKVRRLIVNEFNKIKDSVDAIVFPASRIAPLISEGKINDWVDNYLTVSNFAGAPSLVIPWGIENNMPFGLAIDGKIYEDKKLVSVASYIDELIGGDHE